MLSSTSEHCNEKQSLEKIQSTKNYFKSQRLKLSRQTPAVSGLFASKSFFVNGYLQIEMMDLEFRKLIQTNGGIISRSPSGVDYIIATQLNASKLDSAMKRKSKKVILCPQWVLDCVDQQRLLSVRDYLLLNTI